MAKDRIWKIGQTEDGSDASVKELNMANTLFTIRC